jgi:hypothetical protein
VTHTPNPILAVINGAEDVIDPLEGLVDRLACNAGAAFEPAVLARLCELRKEDRSTFEELRVRLKKAGCRVTALDEAVAEKNGEIGGRASHQADILLDLAADAKLFHTANATAYADLRIDGHRETWPIRGKGFKRWLTRRYFEATQGAPNSEALQSALNVIEARAHFDAPEMDVHVRVGGYGGKQYLDLANEFWCVVEIDEAGWRIVEEAPVRFRRPVGMQPLPMPVAGGSIEALRAFLNVRTDADFVVVVAWALACLRNRGPYPVIVLSGEQGSARPFRRSFVLCSIRMPRPYGLCHARIAICSSLPTMVMCWRLTTCRGCRHGFPTRCAGSPLAVASRCGSCTPTRKRSCSTLPGR